MKSPFLLFTLKCAVILYFAACTNIQNYSVANAVTTVVTKGMWKVNLCQGHTQEDCNEFAGYTFTFNLSGDITASKNDVVVKGKWAEDNIANRLTLNMPSTDPVLNKLNNYWSISTVSNAQVVLENNTNTKLNITSL